MDINIQRKMPDNYTILKAPTNKYDTILGAVGAVCTTTLALGFLGLAGFYLYKLHERKQ